MSHKKTLRIILLASGDLYGGAEAVVYNLVKGLKAYPSINLCVVLLNSGRLADLCMEQEVETKIIDEAKYNFFQLAWKVAHIGRSFRPHIIHSHGYKENILALIARHFVGHPKLVTTVHGMSEGPGKLKTGIASRVNVIAEKYFFDRIVAVSDEITDTFVHTKSIPSRKVIRIHNGIEIPKPKKQTERTQNCFRIGSAGRLFPVKDYPLMVDIARELCAKRDDVRFELAGDGPEKQAIISKIRRYSISDRFKLLGHLDDMEDFYSTIDIYLNTSHHEGLPMTVIEAMAHAIPVVAPHVGGLPEIVGHERVGWLVKNRRAAEFVRVIGCALSSGREGIVNIGKKARDRVAERFSIDNMIESYVSMYGKLLL